MPQVKAKYVLVALAESDGTVLDRFYIEAIDRRGKPIDVISVSHEIRDLLEERFEVTDESK